MATLLGCPHMVITLYVYILGNTLLCPLLVEYQSDWFGVSYVLVISLKSLSINTINYELLRARTPTQEIQTEHNSICMSLPTGVTNII